MSHCPNINSPEWKKLVESVGELEAYAAYIKNGYDIPAVDADGNYSIDDKPSSDIDLTQDDAEADNLKQLTKNRNKILNALKTKYEIYEGSKKQESVKKLKKLIEDFEQADISRSLVIYMNSVDKNITELTARMDKGGNLAFVKLLHDFSGTFAMIKDVSKMMQTRSDISQASKDKVAALVGRVDAFNDMYLAKSKDIMVNELAAQSSIARAKAKKKYAREYEENHPRSKSSMSKKEYDAAKKEYVKNMLNENRAQILRNEKTYVRELLNTAPQDISSFTYHLIDPRGVNDHIIQLAVKQLDKADFAVKEQFIKDRREAMEVFDNYKKSRKGILVTDQKKFYEGIIEKVDGKETGFYVRPFYSHYYKALNEKNRAVEATDVAIERAKIIKEFQKKYQVRDPKTNKWTAKPEYVNKQYKELDSKPETKAMYEYLVNFNKKSDTMVASKMRLGYRLPSMTKNLTETATDNGIVDTATRAWKDAVSIQKDDYQYGEIQDEDGVVKVITDEHGNALRRVMVPFRNRVDIKDQSFSLMEMALSNRFASINYQEKNEIKTELEVLENIMKERDVVQNKNGKKMVRKMRDMFGVEEDEHQELLSKGINSNAYKLMHDIMEDRLYGRRNVKGGEFLGISVDKVAEKAIQFSSNNMLIANYLGGTANVLAGKVMNFLEGTRKMHYSRKDLRAAEGKYINDFRGWSSDVGKVGRPTSKTNMLVEKFIDTSMDFSGMSNDLSKDTKFKQLFQVKTLHGINSAAEHYIQSTLVYAVLNNTKVTNKKGEFIDKDGNITKDRDKAMTMDQAYEAGKDGLVWKNKDWTIEGFEKFDGDVEFVISRKLKDITADLQGNYDDTNRAQVQRYWYGKLGFFLRKWMVRGVQRRWRGIGNVKEGNIEDHAFYSEGQGEFKEGTYASAARYLRNVYMEGKMIQAQIYSQEWNKLSDVEKSNIVSTAYEFGFMMATLTASVLLAKLAKGADSDEEEERLYTAAYLLRRQYGELLFYTPVNPAELSRVMRTPTAALSTVELGTKLAVQLLEDAGSAELEVYQSGRHKGEYKSDVLMNRMFNPFYKNFTDKEVKESYEYHTNIRQ